MLSKQFDLEELKTDANYQLKTYKNSKYFGLINPKTNKRHGPGVMIYDTGRIYEGEWVNDKRNGKGYEKFPNGNFYEGDYVVGKAHGKGVYNGPHCLF